MAKPWEQYNNTSYVGPSISQLKGRIYPDPVGMDYSRLPDYNPPMDTVGWQAPYSYEGIDPLLGLLETADYLTAAPIRYGIKEAVQGVKSGDYSPANFFRGVYKSFANPRTAPTGKDISRELGLSEKGLNQLTGDQYAPSVSPAGVAGFALENVLDPTNLMGAGLFGAGVKAVGKGAKALSKVDDLFEQAKKFKSVEEFIKNNLSGVYNMSEKEFLGNPRITKLGNAKDLVASGGKTVEEIAPQKVKIGNDDFDIYRREGDFKNTVITKDGETVASYDGNTLVVNKGWRKKGIGTYLAKDFRTRNPDVPVAKERTVQSQRLQERVYQQIQREALEKKQELTGIWNQANQPKSDILPRTSKEYQENFKKWFGDSKVVDKDGKPLVVYRGAVTDDIKNGDFPDLKRGFGVGYYSDSPKVAGRYSLTSTPNISKDKIKEAKSISGYSPNVSKAYIDIKNPLTEKNDIFDVFDVDEIVEDLKEYSSVFDYAEFWTEKQKKQKILEILDGASPEFTGASLSDNLKMIFAYIEDYAPDKMDVLKIRFDGVIYDDLEAGGKTIVPLISKSQIKSATGNKGTFDPKDPNILRALTPIAGGGAIYGQQNNRQKGADGKRSK